MEDKNTIELRALNLKKMKEFLSFHGPDRGEARMAFFTEDCSFSCPYYFGGQAMRKEGLAAMEELEKKNVAVYPDWQFQIDKIHETTDPSIFWLEVHGMGRIEMGEDKEKGYGSTPMVLYFHMENGKVREWREYFNPLTVYNLTGTPYPEFRYGEISMADD